MKLFLTAASVFILLACSVRVWEISSTPKPSPPHNTSGTTGSEHPLLNKPAPEFARGFWLNSSSHKLADFRNKVVLIEFWTYGCINCRNTLPTIKGWAEQFKREDFTIIGVHTPEFDAERDLDNVRDHVRTLGITYPVVTDNDYATWDAYKQEYWPVLYLVDRKGIIRYVKIGEGGYDQTEEMIRSLLAEH